MATKKKSTKKVVKPKKEVTREKVTANSHWVKQLYYYLVIVCCLLFICIGLFVFSRSLITYNFFPIVWENNLSYIPENRREAEIDSQYQESLVNSVLMMLVSTIIYFIHTKTIKINN